MQCEKCGSSTVIDHGHAFECKQCGWVWVNREAPPPALQVPQPSKRGDAKINVFIIRQAEALPSDQLAYADAVTAACRPGAVVDEAIILRVDQGNLKGVEGEDVAYAMGLTARLRELGKLPDWGESTDIKTGTDAQGCRFVARFY